MKPGLGYSLWLILHNMAWSRASEMSLNIVCSHHRSYDILFILLSRNSGRFFFFISIKLLPIFCASSVIALEFPSPKLLRLKFVVCVGVKGEKLKNYAFPCRFGKSESNIFKLLTNLFFFQTNSLEDVFCCPRCLDC